jgi:CRISPR/Cas system-associated protein endoribonuclease Cas2
LNEVKNTLKKFCGVNVMEITEIKIAKMKNILDGLKNNNQKAIAQEELLLKQLKEEFEIVDLEEGYELYDLLIDEKKTKEKKVANQTDSLYNSLISEGLINATM